MHEWGESGGISAIVLAIVVAVVLSVGLLQQAVRARVERKQDVRRRQIVAAEEARREQAEADAEYTSMVAFRNNCCAICRNHTTTRCSRCKAVHYCSPQCQKQHWKEGHKQECRAPEALTPRSPSPGSGSSSSGSRNFSDVFSNGSNGSNGSFGSRSRALSEVSDLARVEVVAPAEFTKTPPPSRNGVEAKPTKILFPYDIFVKFFNSESLQVPPCGLINCGNSCFANVVLQCLTYTRPLTGFLLEGNHGEECRRIDWCFMCELQDHVWRVRQNQNPISPIRILSRIRHIGNHLGYGRQEDAHEFMRFAIDSMQSICLDEAGGEKSVDAQTQETTFIHHIFGGHLQSQVKCMQCLHESNRYENMMDLAVEIQGCVESLEDALTQFTAPELLDGENKYKCDRCNDYVKARKRLTMHEAPNILTIALKRFQSGKFGKLNKRVTFPETLDVLPFMSAQGDQPPLYKLYAVVVHVDMLNASFFGHYICYVKDSQGLWYKIDDAKVKEVDIEKVMAQRAYMVFYTRSSARPPPGKEGAIQSQPVGHSSDLGTHTSDRHEGLKVFPVPQPEDDQVDEISTVEESVEHAEVDFNHMQAEEIAEGLVLTSGECAPSQYNSWDPESVFQRIPPIDDGATAEDYSGRVANGPTVSVSSPCISSFRSNPGLWVPSPGFVRQVPNPLSGEPAEHVTLDQCEWTEVNLQPSGCEKPGVMNPGKRRLEDSLSTLPTPKPLDTDQLPAWPTGNHGRSCTCPPYLHVSANQANRSSSYESENSGESLPFVTVPMQHRACGGDQMCRSVGKEHGLEPERTGSVTLETIGEGEEELVARAKRQHIEIHTRPAAEAAQRREDNSQAMDHSSVSDSGGREMDWDNSAQHSESAASHATSSPIVSLHGEGLPVDSTVNEMQLVLIEEKVPSLLLVQVPSSLTPLERKGLGGDDEQPRTSLPSSASPSSIVMGSSDGLAVPSCKEVNIDDKTDDGCSQNSNGESHGVVISTVENSCSLQPFPPVLENATAGSSEDAKQRAVQQSLDHVTLRNSVSENGCVHSEEKRNVSKISDLVTDGPVLESVCGKAQKKLAVKPLFAPGFLNRVRTPPTHPKEKAKSTQVSSETTSGDMNGHCNNVDGKSLDNTMTSSGGQNCSSNGILQAGANESHPAAVNGPLPAASNGHSLTLSSGQAPAAANGLSGLAEIGQSSAVGNEKAPSGANESSPAAANVTVSSCRSCMNGESCNTAHHRGEFENGHSSGNEMVHDVDDKKELKVEIQNSDESSSKARGGVRQRVVNGVGATNGAPATGGVDEDHSTDRVSEPVAPFGRAMSGKQKQGRNATCNCGSQRKWKKCCGKAGVIKPEPGRRRLVV